MDDLSSLLVARKKHANAYGLDSKYANAIDISITGSYGGDAGNADGRGGGSGDSVGGAGSFIAYITSIFATFSCIV